MIWIRLKFFVCDDFLAEYLFQLVVHWTSFDLTKKKVNRSMVIVSNIECWQTSLWKSYVSDTKKIKQTSEMRVRLYIYIYIYIYARTHAHTLARVCVRVCVCVCYVITSRSKNTLNKSSFLIKSIFYHKLIRPGLLNIIQGKKSALWNIH